MATYFQKCLQSAASKGDWDQVEGLAETVARESLEPEDHEQRKIQFEFDKKLLQRLNPAGYEAWEKAEDKEQGNWYWEVTASGNSPIIPFHVCFVEPLQYLSYGESK